MHNYYLKNGVFMNFNQSIQVSLIFLGLLTTGIARSEYVVFNIQDNARLATTEKQYTQVFKKVLGRYQFPMCLKHEDERNWSPTNLCKQAIGVEELTCGMALIEKCLREEDTANVQYFLSQYPLATSIVAMLQEEQLTTSEFDELKNGVATKGEELFLKEKITELDKDIDLLFIPKTLYELFMLKTILEQSVQGQNLIKACQRGNRSPIDYLSKIVSGQNKINTVIIEWLNNNEIDTFMNVCPERIQHIVASLVEELKRLSDTLEEPKKLLENIRKVIFNFDKAQKLMVRAIEIEISAQKKGQFVLYRGTNGFGPYIDLPDSREFRDAIHILTPAGKRRFSMSYRSFGKSLFAGFEAEVKGDSTGVGANVFDYFRLAKIGYAVTIDIQEYYNKGLVYRLFDIPSMSTFHDLLLEGETFHPITKERQNAICPAQFCEFLKNNVVILKNETREPHYTDEQLVQGDNLTYYNQLLFDAKQELARRLATWAHV